MAVLMVPIYYRRQAQTDEKNNNNKLTKTDYVNFIGRNSNAAWSACYDRLVYEYYVYARFFVLEQGQLSEQDLYFFYLFIIFFGNNHGRVRVRACMCNNMRRLPSLSRVGQWSGVQQVNKLDARAKC